MDNRQLAHLWAQQTRASGKASNFFFDGPTLYSYGRHFVVGRFVPPEDGGTPVVLLNSGDYSVTTSRHQSHARMALHGLNVRTFTVPDVDVHGREPWRHERNLAHFRNVMESAMLTAARSRKYAEMHLRDAGHTWSDWLFYCEAFALPAECKPGPLDTSSEALAAAVQRSKDAAKREAAERKAREVKAAQAEAERRAQWRAGECVTCHSEPTMLRVRGDSVETSRGAQVPVEDATRFLKFVYFPALRAGQSLLLPVTVGDFTCTRIEPDGAAIIGCHRLERAEIERVAPALGVQP